MIEAVGENCLFIAELPLKLCDFLVGLAPFPLDISSLSFLLRNYKHELYYKPFRFLIAVVPLKSAITKVVTKSFWLYLTAESIGQRDLIG